ncbi:MAG: helix-turn-helix transcriptional regulator [Ignavibacteriales bacterium]
MARLADNPVNLDNLPPILTAQEVARLLRISEPTARKYGREGIIPGFLSLGERALFRKAAVLELINGRIGA